MPCTKCSQKWLCPFLADLYPLKKKYELKELTHVPSYISEVEPCQTHQHRTIDERLMYFLYARN